MAEWKGIDPGGAEFLFAEEVLVSTLEIFLAEEPFNRLDADSEVYSALEAYNPDIVWRNTDAGGNLRSIFRARNVWKHLGLIADEPEGTVVTELGEALVSGQVQFQDVCIGAAVGHVEGGVKPYVLMAQALLEDPTKLFTAEDIEFGIAQHYVPGKVSVGRSIELATRSAATLTPTRMRRLRSFMHVLEKAGGVTEYLAAHGDHIWGASDVVVLGKIAGAAHAGPAVGGLTRTAPSGEEAGKAKARRRPALPAAGTTGTATGSFIPSGVVVDPAVRLEALERANKDHQEVVVMVAAALMAQGIDAREDPSSFDVGVLDAPEMLVEVKSVHDQNAQAQVRRAIAQLFEYRWQWGMPHSTRLVIALSADPRGWLPADYVHFVENDLHIEVYWRHGSHLVNAVGAGI
jgi:hypothetical protein